MAAMQGKGEDREQQIMLATALKVVRDQSLLMQRAMDGGDANLKITLDYATEMLRELRSNTLTPKNYYELYMSILDQMRYLEEYFRLVVCPVLCPRRVNVTHFIICITLLHVFIFPWHV